MENFVPSYNFTPQNNGIFCRGVIQHFPAGEDGRMLNPRTTRKYEELDSAGKQIVDALYEHYGRSIRELFIDPHSIDIRGYLSEEEQQAIRQMLQGISEAQRITCS